MSVEIPINNHEMMLNIGLEAGCGKCHHRPRIVLSVSRDILLPPSIGFQPLEYNLAGNPMLRYQKKTHVVHTGCVTNRHPVLRYGLRVLKRSSIYCLAGLAFELCLAFVFVFSTSSSS